ncbi:MAG TPA: serine hydrolase, partial [Acetobacteraceae bacterium]
DRFLSQSMAKTITAMLIGIAVQEGAIRSIDQPAADYVPGLAGTEYGKTPIRALLHMASGVAFNETYDGTDDIARLGRSLFSYGSPGAVRSVAMFDHRDVPPGTRFHYASIETEVLGLVLREAVHTTPADYLQSRIWQRIGTEADATWVTDANGQEATYCCFSATLRDWARFGLLLAHDGAWNGRQIIPRQWVLDATTAANPWLEPRTSPPRYGYGFQVWLLPGSRRQFALLGVHGQAIMIDPGAGLVLVHTAVRLKPSQDPAARELRVLWNALVARYAG